MFDRSGQGYIESRVWCIRLLLIAASVRLLVLRMP